ncbi:cell wall hydrolase [Sphingomonas sp. MMS24-J13]|uniref:cell wall hydrolase n=1 Tax=Sphingomonas sp. MMS24-J13 TaxID=3238686 RepID=UPI00384E0A4A
MLQKRSLALLSATGTLVAAGVGFAAITGSPAQSASLPSIPYNVATLAPTEATLQPAVTTVLPAIEAPAAQPAVTQAANAVDPEALECMAKIVHHEAGNQPRQGQIAVARTLLNRIKSGRFGSTVCEVANQHGQFFDTTSYQPSRDSDSWANAVDVSRAVLRGDEGTQGVAHGAMFFRAAYKPASSFFRSRQRVGAIGDHIFYR